MVNYQSQNIKNVQRYLRQLSYFDEQIPAVPIDGNYASETRNAVIIFQRINSIEQTGTVDNHTFDLLYSQYLDSLKYNSPAEQPSIFPYVGGEAEIRVGDEGITCHVINHMLNELSVSYSNIEISEETLKSGKYTPETQSAVISFQTVVGIEPTGTVDHITWDAIASQYNSKAHTGE